MNASDAVEHALVIEEEIEVLREEINKSIVNNSISIHRKEEYQNLLDISKKLDVAIVNYIKRNMILEE